MNKDALSLGLELVTSAINNDGAGKYAVAVREYDLGVGYLTQALADPAQVHNSALISQKIREYTERRNALASSLGHGFEAPAPVAAQAHVYSPPPAPVGGSVSINDILRLAFDVAQHARQEDACGNLHGAFELYTQCLESFLIVYKEESNPALKEQLRSTILEYTTRAEQIKALISGGPPANVAGAPHAQPAPRKNLIRNDDTDGAFEQRVSKSHPGYAGRCELFVSVPRRKYRLDEKIPIHVMVDNQCGRQVETVKFYLLCTTDSYYWRSPDAQERKSETVKTLSREHNFGKVFPLAHGLRFEGDFEYELGPRLKPTERQDPTTLIREYVLVAKCFFSRPWRDLKAFIAISVFP
jgi:hypothetical protein